MTDRVWIFAGSPLVFEAFAGQDRSLEDALVKKGSGKMLRGLKMYIVFVDADYI